MNTMGKNEIANMAERLGLSVQIWAPGDGVRRFEFYGPGFTSVLCLGAREADRFLMGFAAGMSYKGGK